MVEPVPPVMWVKWSTNSRTGVKEGCLVLDVASERCPAGCWTWVMSVLMRLVWSSTWVWCSLETVPVPGAVGVAWSSQTAASWLLHWVHCGHNWSHESNTHHSSSDGFVVEAKTCDCDGYWAGSGACCIALAETGALGWGAKLDRVTLSGRGRLICQMTSTVKKWLIHIGDRIMSTFGYKNNVYSHECSFAHKNRQWL